MIGSSQRAVPAAEQSAIYTLVLEQAGGHARALARDDASSFFFGTVEALALSAPGLTHVVDRSGRSVHHSGFTRAITASVRRQGR